MKKLLLFLILGAGLNAFGQDLISQCKSNGLSQAATVETVLERNWRVSALNDSTIQALLQKKAALQSELDFLRTTQKGFTNAPDADSYVGTSYQTYDLNNIKHHQEAIAKIDEQVKALQDSYFTVNRTNVEKYVASKY